ncbi:hypothetical protein J5X84_36045 [Streptosporangiaceae bacterium NEAU-GS5]|nr:hypothetical protein [Streptosporangiaceae bacterium NEAU-GS5]
MADLEFPPELIEAQRAYWAAERRVADIVARLPSGSAIALGQAAVSEEDRRELAAARAERGRLIDQLYGHPFWQGHAAPEHAREALRRAARAGQAG